MIQRLMYYCFVANMKSLPQHVAEQTKPAETEEADRKVTFRESVDGQQEWTFE